MIFQLIKEAQHGFKGVIMCPRQRTASIHSRIIKHYEKQKKDNLLVAKKYRKEIYTWKYISLSVIYRSRGIKELHLFKGLGISICCS